MKKSFVLCFALMAFATAARAQTARIGVEALPPSFGSPFRTSLSPTIYSTAAVYDALTRFDDDVVLQPALAIKWESINPLTWRFHLRPGVIFSNGAPLTSDAVVNAIEYLTSPEATREGLTREITILKSAKAVDALTVDIVTTEPVPFFPRIVTALALPEPNAWRTLGREVFVKQPVGTGPFKVDAITENKWKLSKFDASWRPAKIKAVEILLLPDTTSRVQALEAGQIDIALTIGPDNIGTLEQSGARFASFPVASVYGLSFITTRGGPFANSKVRRAINMAVDRDRIVNTLLAGRTVAANQPAARIAFGYNPNIPQYPYDPAAAKKLLSEAGYPQGLKFVLEATTASTSDASVFQQVQSDLREIGVLMDIKSITFPLYLSKLAKVEFTGDAFSIGWASWPSIDSFRALQIHSCLRPVYWFCEPSLAPKMLAALTEWDEKKALKLRQEIGQAYHDLAPALFLYEQPLFVGLGAKVKSFSIFSSVIAYDKIEISQ